MTLQVGMDAVKTKGFFSAHRFLLLRRFSQLLTLVLFMASPVAGYWLLKGNLSSSLILETVPLTDPFVFLQTLAGGHQPITAMLLGSALIAGFYWLVGGRSFCSWVCPVNPVTDLAGWAARRLGIRRRIPLSRQLRYWILALTLLLVWPPLPHGCLLQPNR